MYKLGVIAMLKKHSHFWANMLLLADIMMLTTSWLSAYYIRFHLGILEASVIHHYNMFLAAAFVIWPFIFKNMGLYRARRTSSLASEFSDVAKAASLSVIILITFSFFFIRYDFSRLFFIYFWLISIFAVCLERAVFRAVLYRLRKKGYNYRRVLIIGAGELGARVASRMKNNPWMGLSLMGYLDDYKPVLSVVEDANILGRILDVERIVDVHNIDQVVIALPVSAYKRIAYVVEKLADKLVNVTIVPDIYHAMTLNAGVGDLDGLPFINLTDTRMYGWNEIVKRLLDVLVSLLAVTVLALLMIIIAVNIKLTSKGPVLFRQRRYGLDGKVIWVYKFRTMTVCEDGPDVPQAKKCDTRITTFGAFLRRTSLDELPQFFNVLHGDMSVVGPRPHAIAHNELYRKLIKSYMLRHKVKPGITGWAQVNGWRGETDTIDKMQNRVSFDLFYIENWTIWLDMKIMFLTIWRGFVHKNAY